MRILSTDTDFEDLQKDSLISKAVSQIALQIVPDSTHYLNDVFRMFLPNHTPHPHPSPILLYHLGSE
jgi:hypothetical protein